MQLVEVLVADGATFFVQLVEVAVEAEQRAEDVRVEELDDGVDLVDAVLDRRAGEHEGVAASQALDGHGGLGLPVLDALGLVENDHIRCQGGIDLVHIRADLLVVGEGEERRFVVLAQTLGAWSLDDL